MPLLVVAPCQDSEAAAHAVRRALLIARDAAQALGLSAVHAAMEGRYRDSRGESVEMKAAVERAVSSKVNIPPGAPLPAPRGTRFAQTNVQVGNETTMAAGRRLVEAGRRTLALNFANGASPGGGFLHGALAQEETLCRSSALFATLDGDPMYAAHRERPDRASSDWAILSPDVPFFRGDDGAPLDRPWLLGVLTCAAPIAERPADRRAADLLRARIHRVLEIAEAYGYDALVLGAWGCGAFGNDPARTARDFRDALRGRFLGSFAEVVFAIADWSPERRFLGPFRDAFAIDRTRACT
jgi:uncharacterized protein (TIGR02452 family)